MGILQKKSVGNIDYVLIDDMYPTYSGESGTVAISTLGGIFSCESGYTWSTYSNKNISGEISAYNHTDVGLTPTLDSWFNFNGVATTTPFTLTSNSSGFTLTLGNSAPQLNVSNDIIGRFLTISSNTFRAANAQWNQLRAAPARNNVSPIRYSNAHFGTSAQNDTANIITPVMFTGSNRNNDYFFEGYYVDSREGVNSSLSRISNKVSAMMIEEPVKFNETGVSKSFTTNKWITVNDSVNQWFMGTGTTFSGGGTSIYISNDGGLTPSYTNSTPQVSHFYKDFTFPKNLQSNVLIEFYWKGVGEVGLDYGKTYVTPTTVTPLAGTQVSSIYSVGLTNYQNTASFTYQSIIINKDDAIDQTKRLVFSWINDNSSGTNPPFCVDSLRISFYVNDDWYTLTSGDTETFNYKGFSGNGWTVVNGATNFWTVGVSEFSGSNDNYSAYITNANNTTYYGSEFNNADNRGLAQYTTTTAQVSHFYKDFTLTSASTLTFNWKCWGENGLTTSPTNYDYGTVVMTTTGTTPVAGTEVSTVQATAGGNGRIGATTNSGKFNEGYGGSDNNWRTETINLSAYSGQTKRIVFTWKNDGSVGDNPPFVVDNIKITGIGNWSTYLQKIN
jgi:hypothetical protein